MKWVESSLVSYKSHKPFRDLVDALQPYFKEGISDFYLNRAIKFAKHKAEVKNESDRMNGVGS